MVSKKERAKRRFEQKRQNEQQASAKQEERYEQLKINKEKGKQKKKKILIVSALVVVLLISSLLYASFKPGKYDDFAKCLTEKGAVMYGEDWCKYTNGQKNMFGNSFKYINYKVKTGLTLRPTWVINNKTYERVQSFEKLAYLTGCEEYLSMV